ncbi:MAG: acetate kinase [Oscillospiraceae bacterium]
MNILVINAGSSSLKYQLLDSASHDILAKGLCERIGIGGHLKHTPKNGKPVFDEDLAMPTHAEAIKAVLDMLVSKEYGVIESPDEIGAVGHRVVHGGEKFACSVVIDDAVMQALIDCIPLAPLHNPANITGIKACQAVLPGVPMVAVFDTAFHQTIPPKAFLYALPYEYYVENQVRRYGFHGTSHKYVSQRAANMMGKPLGSLKLISCHLGNGSSVTAIKYGKSIETSMGFTPLDGLPMGTRCGAIDPSIVEYIMKARNMTIDEVNDAMNKKSGVLGISGVSSDFRDLDVAAAQGNERAQLAIDLFSYKVTKRIGSAAAAMGGVDAVIFTAGVGENGAEMRAEICAELGFMGIKLDAEKNNVHGKELDISAPDATVKTLVIPTNEELMIAIDTYDLVTAKK